MEEIKILGKEIETYIKKKHNTEAGFARNTGRNKQTVNGIMNKLKDGRGVKISTILKILDDLNLKLYIQDKEEEGILGTIEIEKVLVKIIMDIFAKNMNLSEEKIREFWKNFNWKEYEKEKISSECIVCFGSCCSRLWRR